MTRLEPLTSDALALSGLRHAFFTRQGGVSTDIYAGLNTGLGSGDARASVLENRSRAARHLGVELAGLATPHQIHSADAVAVDVVWAQGKGPKADALVTDRPGTAIGVGTADCGPLLFADREAGVVGAAHAGWKGALGGVIDSTLATMEALGASRERIVAVLGPTIAQDSYEVDDEFRRRFEGEDPESGRFFADGRPGHAQFDLPGFILSRLRAAGVEKASALGADTYSDPGRFFSYRRACHQGEPDYGRLLSAIVLDAD